MSRCSPDSTVWWVDRETIDRERILRGWTRGRLAREAGVDPGTLSDMFLGRRRPTLGTIQAICTALDLGLGDVIRFEAPRTGVAELPSAVC